MILKKTVNIARKSYSSRLKKLSDSLGELDVRIKEHLCEMKDLHKALDMHKDIKHEVDITPELKRRICVLSNQIDPLSREYDITLMTKKKFEQNLKALTSEGFKDITYLLPTLCIFGFEVEPDYVYLLLTGIRKNAREKQPRGALIDELETVLLQYEREIDKCFDKNYRIYNNKVESLYELLVNYTKEVFFDERFQFRDTLDYGLLLDTLSLSYTFYIIEQNTGIKLNSNYFEEIYKKMQVMRSRGYSMSATIIRLIEEYSIQNYSVRINPGMNEKKCTDVNLSDFISERGITRLCNREVFDEALQSSNISGGQKNFYADLMDGTTEFVEKMRYKKRCAKLRRELFTPEEEELYMHVYHASKTSLTGAFIEKIEAIVSEAMDEFEPLMEELRTHFDDGMSNEEVLSIARVSEDGEVEGILENMAILFDMIREDLKPWTKNLQLYASNAGEMNKTVCFMESIKNEDEEEEAIPAPLKNIISLDREKTSMLYNQLKQLLSQNTQGDRLLKKSTPYPVYIKGREVKIFYTVIEGVVVIIDMCEATGEEYKRVVETVRSDAFKSFIQGSLKSDVNVRLAFDIIYEQIEMDSKRKRFTY